MEENLTIDVGVMQSMEQVMIDESSIKALVASAVPDWEWLISEIKSEDGWIRFPPFLSNAITNLKIENYPLLYDNRSAGRCLTVLGRRRYKRQS
jgi:hypothetical protein